MRTFCLSIPFFLIPLLVVLLIGCKKHEQPDLTPVNVDCNCATEVSADFEILELESLPQFNPVGTDSDTIFHNKNVIFRAKEENAEYTWYIGNEILDTKEVGRNFSAAWGGQDITVSLVVKKATNAICLPNDDGYDSISRTFHVQPYGVCDPTSSYINDTTLMEGVYRMKSPHLSDSFDVIIDYVDRPTAIAEEIDILNFDGMGSNAISIPRCIQNLKTYRGLWISGNSTGLLKHCIDGIFLNRLDGVAIFEFNSCQYDGINPTTYQEYKLVGRKL